MKTIAFVGNPNAGKTAWINALSDAGFKVGNWPGVTVEKKMAEAMWGDEKIQFIDLPGIYDLAETNNEEKITQEFLANEKVDCLINVLDATNLQRSLKLTCKLRLLQIPMVLIFNFYDEVIRHGIAIDAVKIGRRLQCPLICASAFDKQKALQVRQMVIQQVNTTFTGYHPLFRKELEQVWLDQLKQWQLANSFQSELVGMRIVSQQMKQADPEKFQIEQQIILNQLMSYVHQDPKRHLFKTQKIDSILLHRFWGLPLFFVFSVVMLLVIFNGSAPYVAWFNQCTSWFQHGFYRVFFFVPTWLSSLVCDGIIAGVGGVLSFIPLMAFLYFFLAILEESGYMARIAFLMDRLMRPFGCSGKAFVSLLLGLGCNVPSIMATRVIEEEKSKRRTALLVPFMSCGARLPIYLLFAAAFFPKQGGLVIATLYGLGIMFAMVVSLLLSFTTRKSDQQNWMMLELPVYRLPSLKVVLNKVSQEVKNYTKKAFSVVLVAMIFLWGFSYFPQGKIETSYAAQFGKAASFIYEPLGFGQRWQLIASLPGSLAAKETVVGFLSSTLTTQEEHSIPEFWQETKELGFSLIQATKDSVCSIFQFEQQGQDPTLVAAVSNLFQDSLAKLRAYNFLVYILLSIPCVMTLNAIRQEYGKKLMFQSILLMLILPYLVSLFLFQVGSWLFVCL